MSETNKNNGCGGFDFFSISEIESILEATQLSEPVIYMLCKFLWCTGVRISEALVVKPQDIDSDNAVITIKSTLRRSTKHKTRLIDTPENVLEELLLYIKINKIRKNSRIFPFTSRTALNYTKKACNLANVNEEKAHPSSFRHSYAIHRLGSGDKIDKINYLLGNRDIKKTLKYLDIFKNSK